MTSSNIYQQQALLVQVLEGEPPGGGRWSGPKVGLWMSELLGPLGF
ncbi:MAG: hypothetical protein MGG11_16120 [Trichodesmium sp. MAG_R03]|nr:hypothetical protein [Trichodesmium sp. MAG_R03]